MANEEIKRLELFEKFGDMIKTLTPTAVAGLFGGIDQHLVGYAVVAMTDDDGEAVGLTSEQSVSELCVIEDHLLVAQAWPEKVRS